MNQLKFVSLTNITDDEFTFKWDGMEMVLEKGETVKLEEFMARHGAKTMAIEILSTKQGQEVQRIIKETGKTQDQINVFTNVYSGEEHNKLVAKALGKEKEDYTLFNKDELLELAKENGIEVKADGSNRLKTKVQLIKELNDLN